MQKTNDPFEINTVLWREAEASLVAIRTEVFINEQHVPIELEWDECDASAIHLLATDTSGPIGCARILQEGKIGRMAVIRNKRRHGVGMKLLRHAIKICREHAWLKITLSAQSYAIPFYKKAGFQICSEEYMDAGIPHHDMFLDLTS